MNEERFWEIDFVRGVALVMMIFFHILFDIYYIKGFRLIKNNLFWLLFPRLTASIFIVVSGVCLSIIYQRDREKRANLFLKYLKRGLKIFSIGIMITIATFLFIRKDFIIFGILHFLGLSSIMIYPFLRFKEANLILGPSFIFIGLFLSQYSFNFPHLLFLGFAPNNFSTLDYFPIFPWFGLILIGIFLGSLLYKDGKRCFKIMDISSIKLVKLLCILGRNSLKIYLAHQPIIILFILLIFDSF